MCLYYKYTCIGISRKNSLLELLEAFEWFSFDEQQIQTVHYRCWSEEFHVPLVSKRRILIVLHVAAQVQVFLFEKNTTAAW